ncbi:TIGR03618 family F420-dependent PPOX class oxidoreductase [Ferrimicrobium sp.]|uniref:TIGR03618 family F420-dependent PPOX class oxidoreductase n=1 Tax=Ferrimicrobium sp. TaxID=2926050 RepID=UPI00260B17E2|nr:TIGR03618 family F420-dependent PPOX class oxidoreductase [Ferrimicrobium sp.]
MATPPKLEFLATNHHAVLGTYRSDGGVQLSPVLAVPMSPTTIGVSSRETAIKTRNLRRNPTAFVCAFPDSFFGSWIQADGIATIYSLPTAMDRLIDYYRLAAGEHNDWASYREAMVTEHRVLIEIAVTRIGPTVSG